MAALNYPVVGVDVLRYFWEHKTPEQAAADLSATMAYYRKKLGYKVFCTGWLFVRATSCRQYTTGCHQMIKTL